MDYLTVDNLISQFQAGNRTHFTGRLDLQTGANQKWSLYFHLGRLVWATGGVHRFRRWRRQFTKFCPQLHQNELRLAEAKISEFWEYLILSNLLKQQKITREQVVAVVEGILTEVLFDVLQEEVEQIRSTSISKDSLASALAIFNAEQMLRQAQQAWEVWCNADLAPYSPNLSPVLKRPEELKQRTSASAYQTLVSLMDGNSSLRDLAAKIKQDPLVLTRSLLPHIRKGLIALVERPDLFKPDPVTQPQVSVTTKAPLIACIDDSPQICQLMEQMLNRAGYQFVSVQDSVQALPMLLERRPSLIFLDLVMPVANGYEICSQIRRIALFQNTPVIILTGNDGIVDRVRAKLVGASDFLTKPIEPEKVLTVVQRYLELANRTPLTQPLQYQSP